MWMYIAFRIVLIVLCYISLGFSRATFETVLSVYKVHSEKDNDLVVLEHICFQFN